MMHWKKKKRKENKNKNLDNHILQKWKIKKATIENGNICSLRKHFTVSKNDYLSRLPFLIFYSGLYALEN